jgi:hypothetical protein
LARFLVKLHQYPSVLAFPDFAPIHRASSRNPAVCPGESLP